MPIIHEISDTFVQSLLAINCNGLLALIITGDSSNLAIFKRLCPELIALVRPFLTLSRWIIKKEIQANCLNLFSYCLGGEGGRMRHSLGRPWGSPPHLPHLPS
jgi:hypothetical protein